VKLLDVVKQAQTTPTRQHTERQGSLLLGH